jgi:hypothetical protein
MFRKLKEFFFGKSEPVVEAPYKVEAPAVVVVETASVKAEIDPVVVNELAKIGIDAVAEIKAAIEVPTPVKKPRKPRAPKVVVQPKEKAPKKKPVAAITANPKAKKS